MDPLHATIEEFAAEGFTHIECHCPRCRVFRLRRSVASSTFDGTEYRAAFSTNPVCGVRWTAAFGRAVATKRRAGQAARTAWVTYRAGGYKVVRTCWLQVRPFLDTEHVPR
jgi:hypothetical protein